MVGFFPHVLIPETNIHIVAGKTKPSHLLDGKDSVQERTSEIIKYK